MIPGDKRGPYEILDSIGKGGMGEVYRARDTRVGREVAIKISVEQFGERFEREAQAIASLNHPNICTLYDVGPDFLVMELVEGESPKGPLPLETALDYARQIAAALEAAHDRGIVHRDLKPANIKITPQGLVKVLDFGLAKVASPQAKASGASMETSPTFSMAATQAGMVLGTAAYMAPEQARGMIVDKRADIWAFGVVLYEMLTGKRLFQGEDLTDTIAAVVRDKPDLSAAPPEVRRVLERCLEKDPRKRLRDISGVQLLLETTASPTPQMKAPSGTWTWLPSAIALVAVVAFAAIAFIHFREAAPELQGVTFLMSPPPDSVFTNEYGALAASPDGKYLVFAARGKSGPPSLWLRPVDSLSARALPGTESANFPTWSPDSKSLAFLADNKLKRIEIAGGAPLTLADATNTRVSPTGTWNRDGVILFGNSTGLMRVSASGGGATPLTKVDINQKETGHGYPQFLPDGNHFIYFVDSSDPNVQGIYGSSLTNPGQRQQIVRTGAKAVYIRPRAAYPGYLLWVQDQTLLAQRFDPDRLVRSGDPVSVAEDIGLNPGTTIRAAFWASEAGLLVYIANPTFGKRPAVWMSRDGKVLGEAGPEDTYLSIALSPDLSRLAMTHADSTSGRSSNVDIWLREFARGIMTRLTFNAADDRYPVWSPDGKQVAFASNREAGIFQIYLKDSSGTGMEERLTDGPTPKTPLDWSKDGKFILYREETASRNRDLLAVRVTGDRKPIPVLTSPFADNTGAISPDSRWIAYSSIESGRNEIYVQAFPGVAGAPKGRWQISTSGGYDVRWRGDGKEIYYQTMDIPGSIMSVTIQTSSEGVRAEAPRALFSADFRVGDLRGFEVTPDGQRFLIALNQRQDRVGQLVTIVTNWQATLRK